MFNQLNWYEIETCYLCGGSGKLTIEKIFKRDNDQDDLEGEDVETCPICNGEGELKVRIK